MMKPLVYVLALGNLILIGFMSMTTKSNKIGVVKMEQVVYSFQGMKESTRNYEEKIGKWKGESDSLQSILKGLYSQIKADSVSNNKIQLKRDVELFYLYRNSYIEHERNIEVKAREMDSEMTSSVITQLNSYMEEFAEKVGFDLILCNNPQYQGVGYTKSSQDVTKEFLEFSNKKYSGEK